MSRVNKTKNRLMEVWNDLDEAYEHMERSLEKLSSMSKQRVEMLLGNEAFEV